MPRIGRVVLPNYPHHIVQRGHNRQVVFAEEDDFRYYLSTLRNWKTEYGVKVYGYCLMTNHIHLLLRPRQVPISRISFADALAWLRHATSQSLPRLRLNPDRPNRVEPRVLKRRPKAYPPMRQPRDELRKALRSNNKAA